MLTRIACAIVGVVLISPRSDADEWPGWRGPRGDSISTERDVPLRWSATENIAWKTPIPGNGHSSPIVFGDRVFVTTCIETEEKRLLLCYDRTRGRLLWRKTVIVAPLEAKNSRNSYASSTPVTDGKCVWVSFQENDTMLVACYSVDGELRWRRSPGKYTSQHGFCSSPVLFDDLVLLIADQEVNAYLVALDQKTGATRWLTLRPNSPRSYSAPQIVDVGGKKQMILPGSKCIASYDPRTGKELWRCETATEKFVAGIAFADGVVCATGASPASMVIGIRPDGHGNVTETHVLWQSKQGAAYVPSPVACGKHVLSSPTKASPACTRLAPVNGCGQNDWERRIARHPCRQVRISSCSTKTATCTFSSPAFAWSW